MERLAAHRRVAMLGYTDYTSDARLKGHVAALRHAGHEVDVVALGNAAGHEAPAEEGVRFLFPFRRGYDRRRSRMALGYAAFTLAAARLLLSRHSHAPYDVVHVNNMPNFLALAALPLRLLGVGVILDVHDPMPELYQEKFGVPAGHWMVRLLRLEERLGFACSDFVLTTEHTKLERLVENGLDPARAEVLLNLPDPHLFAPLPPRPPRGGDSPFVLAYHGTLAHRLGLDLVVRAVALLAPTMAGLRLRILGDGDYRGELTELIGALGLWDRVELSDGFLPVERVRERLMDADLGVVAMRDSIGTRLGLPVKILEYMSLGIPCLTTPAWTTRRYFNERQVAFARPDDPEDLARAIRDLAGDPERRATLASEGTRFVARHGVAETRGRYLSIVERVSAARGRGPWRVA